MRRAILTTLIVATGLVGAGHDQASAAGLGFGSFCEGGIGNLNVNIYDDGNPAPAPYDIWVDDDNLPAAENVALDTTTTIGLSDGIHTITVTDDNGDIVRTVKVGLSCGEPVGDATATCVADRGALHVIAINGTGPSLDLYLDGALYLTDLNNSNAGDDYTGIPDGTYVVSLRPNGQPNVVVYSQEITVDCVQNDQPSPATVSVKLFCGDESELSMLISTVNSAERFNISLDGQAKFTNAFWGEYTVVTTAGAHHLVVTNNSGATVYDDYLLFACNGPLAVAKSACVDGHEQISLKTAEQIPYSWNVSVDGTAVPSWQDVPSTDGDWAVLGTFAAGQHTVLVEWNHVEAADGSQELIVTSDCLDSGSGAGLPQGGSETTPMLITAGLLILAGFGLVSLRRPRLS